MRIRFGRAARFSDAAFSVRAAADGLCAYLQFLHHRICHASLPQVWLCAGLQWPRLLRVRCVHRFRRLLGWWQRSGSLPTPRLGSRPGMAGTSAAPPRERSTGPSSGLAKATAAEAFPGRSGSGRLAAATADGGGSGRPGPSFASDQSTESPILGNAEPSALAAAGSPTASSIGRSGSGRLAATAADGGGSGRPGPSCASDESAESPILGNAEPSTLAAAGSPTASSIGCSSSSATGADTVEVLNAPG
jgi:hypothetical protein